MSALPADCLERELPPQATTIERWPREKPSTALDPGGEHSAWQYSICAGVSLLPEHSRLLERSLSCSCHHLQSFGGAAGKNTYNRYSCIEQTDTCMKILALPKAGRISVPRPDQPLSKPTSNAFWYLAP